MLDTLIKYFVYKTKGHITKTQIVKFLYLADLYSVKWTRKPLTDLDWRYYLHAPWSENIDKALEQMEGREISQQGQGGTLIIGLGPMAGTIEELKLPLSLELMLENIRREWAGAGDRQQELLDYVYNTAPMVEVSSWAQLNRR